MNDGEGKSIVQVNQIYVIDEHIDFSTNNLCEYYFENPIRLTIESMRLQVVNQIEAEA